MVLLSKLGSPASNKTSFLFKNRLRDAHEGARRVDVDLHDHHDDGHHIGDGACADVVDLVKAHGA